MIGDRKDGVKEINNKIKKIEARGNEVFGQAYIAGKTTSLYAASTTCESHCRVQAKINYSLFHKCPKTVRSRLHIYLNAAVRTQRLEYLQPKLKERPVKSKQSVTGARLSRMRAVKKLHAIFLSTNNKQGFHTGYICCNFAVRLSLIVWSKINQTNI